MIGQLWHAVLQALQSQVGGGVLVLSLVGSAIAFGRSIPGRILRILQRQFIVSVDIVGGDPLFGWMSTWLDAQPYSRRTRILTASGKRDGASVLGAASSSAPDLPPLLLTPAPGHHLIWYAGRPVWLMRERKEVNGSDGMFAGFRETMTIRILGRSQATARALLEDARAAAHTDERRVGIYVLRYGEWVRATDAASRSLESVCLPAGMMEDLVADLEEFLNRRKWYERRGIPWRRGYFFEGPPRTGKTSAFKALAAHHRLDLYLCPVTDKSMNDERLLARLLDVPERSALLLEDVDCIARGREMQTDGGGITFSGLLNAMDGAASKEGMVIFMTSNHPEHLDEALLGDGRIDVRRHIGLAAAEQAARRFLHFFPNSDLANQFGEAMKGETMARVQGVLIDHADDPRAALRAASIRLAAA